VHAVGQGLAAVSGTLDDGVCWTEKDFSQIAADVISRGVGRGKNSCNAGYCCVHAII
jgi:hypothetical protein